MGASRRSTGSSTSPASARPAWTPSAERSRREPGVTGRPARPPCCATRRTCCLRALVAGALLALVVRPPGLIWLVAAGLGTAAVVAIGAGGARGALVLVAATLAAAGWGWGGARLAATTPPALDLPAVGERHGGSRRPGAGAGPGRPGAGARPRPDGGGRAARALRHAAHRRAVDDTLGPRRPGLRASRDRAARRRRDGPLARVVAGAPCAERDRRTTRDHTATRRVVAGGLRGLRDRWRNAAARMRRRAGRRVSRG